MVVVVFFVALNAGSGYSVNSVTKSVRAYTLIIVWGTYSMSNSPNSIADLAI